MSLPITQDELRREAKTWKRDLFLAGIQRNLIEGFKEAHVAEAYGLPLGMIQQISDGLKIPRRRHKRNPIEGFINEIILCECGCGTAIKKYNSRRVVMRYCPGHNRRGAKKAEGKKTHE